MPRLIVALSTAAALSSLVACMAPSMPEQDEGAVFFAQNCQSCHGAGGQGNGPLAGDLAQKPTDLTQLAQGNGGAFPTARALSYVYGDPENGHLARVMPQFGGAMADDLVPVEVDGVLTPTPRALAGVLAYLEAIQS